nr:CotH kinase family protein [Bacteroidota bacterium]
MKHVKNFRILNPSFLLILLIFIVSVTISNAQVFSSGNISSTIPDDGSFHVTEVMASGLPSATSANFGIEKVCIDIQHPDVKELSIKLISPDNTILLLDEFYSGANYENTCFTGLALNHVLEGQAPFSGSFKPVGDLGKFNNGINPNGEWKLQVEDTKTGNVGEVISWSISFSNAPVKSFISSNLPIMVINTNGQTVQRNVRIMVDMGVISNGSGVSNKITDPWNHYSGKASIRYRGQSSMMFPKKPYALDTKSEDGEDRDYPLLDMPSEHKWVLYASYSDKTLLRNVLSMQLFASMGHYSVQTRFIELVFNGDYQGLYVVMEKIKRDRRRVAVTKMNPEDVSGNAVSGGYIISIDKWSDKRDSWQSIYPSNVRGDRVRFQYVYPRPDNIQPAQKQYIKNYVDQFENALMGPNFKDPEQGYRKYIHTTSFINNFILHELCRDVDAYRASTYFYKDRDTVHHVLKSKLINGPVWDFDMAWYNANFGGANEVVGWQYQYGYNFAQGNPADSIYPVPFWWRRLMEDPAFVDEVHCRYMELRKDIISPEALHKRIDVMAEQIKEARIRNFNHWPVMGQWVYSNIMPVAQTYEDEIIQFKNWITKRIEWLDKSMPGTCPNLSVEEQAPLVSSLEVYPNPFRSGFNLSYYLRQNSKVSVELINSMGSTVSQVSTGNQTAGTFNDFISVDNLPNGIYMLLV